MKKVFSILGLLLLLSCSLYAQHPKREFQRLDVFPAIAYAPETRLTLGVIGTYNMDFYRDDPNTRLSNLTFLAAYTLNKQIVVEGYWDISTNGNKYRFRGETFFNRYPDRNYGLGNDASTLVAAWNDDEPADTVNYLFFNSDRIKFAANALRLVSPNLYVGLNSDLEYLYQLRPIPDHYQYLNADSSTIINLPVDGLRSGLGLQVLYDSRDFVLNPMQGNYLELSHFSYGPWIGSDFSFTSLRLDARTYRPTWKNQTLALRAVAGFKFSEQPIPMRGLYQIGGRDFVRGYFKGTYQDNHVLAFEAEYRLPLWKENPDTHWYQVWKRLGLVAFVSGAQVGHEPSDFAFERFHLAAGGGLRILFNKKTRSTLRIDYAFGLEPDSNGPGKRQSGFYFFLGEAF